MANDIPHIEAECSGCHLLFDMKFHTVCPYCNHAGVAWARLVPESEFQAKNILKGTVENVPKGTVDANWEYYRPKRTSFLVNERNWTLTEGEKLDIAELDRVYALEDKRTNYEPINSSNSRTL